MIKERTSTELISYFNKNVPDECKNLTYGLFKKEILENPELVRKFDNNNYFKRIHKFLIKTGYNERETFLNEEKLKKQKALEYKIGSVTTPIFNNSWQFGSKVNHYEGGFRYYDDLTESQLSADEFDESFGLEEICENSFNEIYDELDFSNGRLYEY